MSAPMIAPTHRVEFAEIRPRLRVSPEMIHCWGLLEPKEKERAGGEAQLEGRSFVSQMEIDRRVRRLTRRCSNHFRRLAHREQQPSK